jgi:hypothetical protein
MVPDKGVGSSLRRPLPVCVEAGSRGERTQETISAGPGGAGSDPPRSARGTGSTWKGDT